MGYHIQWYPMMGIISNDDNYDEVDYDDIPTLWAVASVPAMKPAKEPVDVSPTLCLTVGDTNVAFPLESSWGCLAAWLPTTPRLSDSSEFGRPSFNKSVETWGSQV